MEITDVKTYVVGTPPPHHGGVNWVFLKLTTRDNIVGFGEAYGIPFHRKVSARVVEDICERMVIGTDPFNIEKLWPDRLLQRLLPAP